MKKKGKAGTIARWVFTALWGICVLGNGFHWTSLFLILATVLMAPIPALAEWLNEHKIKNWMAVTASVVLVFIAAQSMPASTTTSTTPDTTITQETDKDKSDEDEDKIKEEEKDKDTDKKEETKKEETKQEPVGTGKAEAVSPSSIPAYSGNAFVQLNNNIPNFSSAELKTTGYENYGSLDSLGRVTTATASLGKDTMPKADEKRGSISSIKPTGWVQATYDNVSGKYLYNRCHLIGWQLSAENANKQNLITGTRNFNINGMLPFENMVADYIKETNNHVAYRVTPIFEGTNLLCKGVQIEAYSVEDKGEGIQFNVFVYNVQPDINIDYATGNSSSNVKKEETPVTPPPSTNTGGSSNSGSSGGSSGGSGGTTTTPPVQETPTVQQPTTPSAGMVWIPTKGGTKYHSHSGCSNMNGPIQVTEQEAINQGFGKCKRCW